MTRARSARIPRASILGTSILASALLALSAGCASAQSSTGDAVRLGQAACLPIPVANPSVADLELLERAADALKDRLPFTQRNVAFVTKKADGFRDIRQRPDNVFPRGEVLRSYAEPLGYALKPAADGALIALSMDFLVRTASGKVLAQQTGFEKVSVGTTGRAQPFFLNLSLNLTGIEPGEYVLTYTLHDETSGKTTSFDQPFVIKG